MRTFRFALRGQVVVRDPDERQKRAKAAANADREATLSAIREGLDDVAAGRTKPARLVLKELARKYGLDTPAH